MHRTSGCTAANHSSTLGMRAFSELTFHVAISTAGTLISREDAQNRTSTQGNSGGPKVSFVLSVWRPTRDIGPERGISLNGIFHLMLSPIDR